MKRLERLGLGLTLVVLLLATAFAVRVTERASGARWEVSRVTLQELSPATRARLAGLEEDVLVTYYVTARSEMPSRLRRLERGVTDVLEAFAEAADGRLRYQIVDPSLRPDLVGYVSGQRVAPFRVRSVQRDAYTEATIYSTLTIAYGIHPPAVIQGVLPEHLPRLQQMLVGHLDQMEEPRAPVFALAAETERYTALAEDLAATGEVRPFDLASGEEVPGDVDVLFWLDPGDVGETHLARLRRFLDDGGSAVVAGSTRDAVPAGPGALRFQRTGYDAATLLGGFGLRPGPELVLDGRCESVEVGDELLPAPHLVHCIAPNQDFHTLEGQPNGHLYFHAPTPPAVDGDLASELGWRPEVLATTSERTWLQPWAPDATVSLGELSPENGTRAPKLPLLTLLRPVDPWRGAVLFGASSSPFRDGVYGREDAAHRALLRVLTRTFASPDRLVTRRAGIASTEPLPELDGGQRLAWRALCIGLGPLLLGAVAVARGAFRRGVPEARRGGRTLRTFARPLLAGLAVVLGATALARGGLRLDATEDDLNSLAETTARLAAASRGGAALEAELFVSRPGRLPPGMRPGVRALGTLLDELERAGAELDLSRRDPADLGADEQEALAAQGIEPFRVHSRADEVTTVRTVWATLRLRSRGREETLSFPSEAAFEHLELRVAFALWRLAQGGPLHVAFASDLPRLSPAEAHEDYQLRGRFAPSGTDVYSLARAALQAVDFRVTHVDPRSPEVPDDADLLLWFQPRRDVTAMLEEAVRSLRSGRPLFLATQHFNVQPRQYPGADFETVYWPQPQFCDVERIYWPDVGIRLVREVLFDELSFPLEVETHVNRDLEARDYEAQHSALPFLIRASASNFAADSPVTAGLGDQGFVWGNRVEWDPVLLAQHGLTARPLMTTSERSWSFEWSGGWLPPAVLEGPVDEESAPLEDPSAGYLGHVPLLTRFDGVFPPYRAPDPATGEPREGAEPVRDDPRSSTLLLAGGSELFQNDRLYAPDLRADHLLINAAFELAAGEELSSVAARRRVPRGFDWVEPEARLRWRALVLAAGPVLLLLFGAVRGWVRRRT